MFKTAGHAGRYHAVHEESQEVDMSCIAAAYKSWPAHNVAGMHALPMDNLGAAFSMNYPCKNGVRTKEYPIWHACLEGTALALALITPTSSCGPTADLQGFIDHWQTCRGRTSGRQIWRASRFTVCGRGPHLFSILVPTVPFRLVSESKTGVSGADSTLELRFDPFLLSLSRLHQQRWQTK